MRYALIAVAIGTSLFFAWLAWIFLGEAQQKVLLSPDGDYFLASIFVVSALLMGLAAGGLIGRRAWGAYPQCRGAFPFGSLSLLGLPVDTTQLIYNPALPLGLLALAVGVGVSGLRLGRSMRREAS
jgi:hypothetical protein